MAADGAFAFGQAKKGVPAVVRRMVPGGILIADNAINHRAILQPMLDRALRDERVDALIVPIGNGELVCRESKRFRCRQDHRPQRIRIRRILYRWFLRVTFDSSQKCNQLAHEEALSMFWAIQGKKCVAAGWSS